jgi:hypothetical protein
VTDADGEPRIDAGEDTGEQKPEDTERVTLSVDSWAFEVAELPRVLPDGWTHFAVIAAGLEAHLDGVEWVGPDPTGAVPSDRHRYEATVTTDAVDHEHVRIVDRASAGDDGNDGVDEKADAAGDNASTDAAADAGGEATTEAFDVSDALDRL